MKTPSSSVSKGSDPLSSADVLPAGSPEVSAKSGPVASGPPAPAPSERLPKDMLAEFGAAILDAYTDDWRLYLDDGDIYDTAVAYGLIVQRAEKHPPEEECEACTEFDAPCCEVPPNISRAVAALLREKP